MMKEIKYIVFAVDHFSPLGVIRSLGESGFLPIVILFTQQKPILVNYCRYISKLHQVKTIEDGFRILMENYAEPSQKHILFATNDTIESYLDLRWDELIDYFYFYHAGEKGRVSHMMEKNVIVKMAQQAGLKTPKTVEVSNGEMPNNLQYPILTKATTSTIQNWKSNVFICRNEQELREAYKQIECKRVILQEYIEKVDELNIEGFCINDGKDVYMPLQNRFFRVTDSSYGNYAFIEQYSHPDLSDKIHRLFEMTHYNGVFEMEFMIGKDGELYFLEINFRNSAWLYAYTRCGVNFPLMFAKSIMAGRIIDEDAHITKLPFTFMDELTDFKWSVWSGNLSLFTWLFELKNVDCVFYYDKHDKKPLFMYLFNRLKGLLL